MSRLSKTKKARMRHMIANATPTPYKSGDALWKQVRNARKQLRRKVAARLQVLNKRRAEASK